MNDISNDMKNNADRFFKDADIFIAKMKANDCPEGHICTSDCQNTKDCPCMEHEHTMTQEEKRIATEDMLKSKFL